MIILLIDFIWETQMANVTGICNKMAGPDECTLEVISLNAISLLNGCLQWSKMTLLRMLRLFYILEWMRLKAILLQVCSVSFTAFTNVCLHFCHRCSGMWNWNGVWIPKEFTIWSEIECDILASWHKPKPFNVTFGLDKTSFILQSGSHFTILSIMLVTDDNLSLRKWIVEIL